MLRVFMVYAPANRHNLVIKALQKGKLDYAKTALSEYIVVYEDPTECLKDISGIKITEITGERYLDMLEDRVFFEKILSPIKPGDTVEIIEGQFAGATGVVERVTKKQATVLLTVWGIPYRADLPLESLQKVVTGGRL